MSTESTDPFEQFVAAIVKRAHEYFDETDMPPEFVEDFGRAFAGQVDRAFDKFARGQVKHGGDLRQRDLENEETQEIIDLFCYRAAKQTLRATANIYV